MLTYTSVWIFIVHTGGPLTLYAIIEWWFGETPKTPAASAVSWILNKVFSRPYPAKKGNAKMPQETTTLVLSKNCKDVLQVGTDFIDGLISKKPMTDIATSELPALLRVGPEVTQLGPEFREDPVSFCRTIGATLGEWVGKGIKFFAGPKTITPGAHTAGS